MENKIIETTVNRKELETQLAIHNKVTSGYSALAICSTVHMALTSTSVIMRSTDLETVYWNALSVTGQEGIENKRFYVYPDAAQTCIPISSFMKAVKAIPKKTETVKLEMIYDIEDYEHPSEFRINGTITVVTMNPDDFPTTPRLPDGSWHLYYDVLTAENISQVKAVKGHADDHRPHIIGALFNFRDGELVKTDGSRLHISTIGTAPYDSVLVPMKSLNILLHNGLKKKIGMLRVSKNNMFIKLGDDAYLCSRLLDGEFPEYHSIIDREACGYLVTSDSDLITDLIKEAKAITADHYKAILFNLNSHITVNSTNPDIGDFSKTLDPTEPAWYLGPELEIAYNPGYLLEAIAQLPADQQTLSMKITSGGVGPCVIESLDRTFRAAVMPMQL